MTTIPKVSIQLWYGVGSKHEKDGERGLAHLLEHMIFKGTERLSECDINQITHRLSGYANAFTSHDYTCYVFDMPKQHIDFAFDLLADCMRNCTFKEDLLHAEIGAVIQELKMYQDDYSISLVEHLISSIFNHHPYHYPIIGYKHDLWAITRDSLVSFYKQHYIPNNATLIVVGDIDPEEVANQVRSAFESIPASETYHVAATSFVPDLQTHSLALYRDVQIPQYIFAFVVPGLKMGTEYIIDIASWILAEGKASRLYRQLVDRLQLATDVGISLYDLFDASVLCIRVSPSKKITREQILAVINEELNRLQERGIEEHELERAKAHAAITYMSAFENISRISHALGRSYLATGNENAIFKYLDLAQSKDLASMVNSFFASYINPYKLNSAALLPLTESERKRWFELQHKNDELDQKKLETRKRVSALEDIKHAQTISPRDPSPFAFARAKKEAISSGLKILWAHNKQSEKVDIILDLKAKYFYDPLIHEGIGAFVAEMLVEGTERWNAEQLVQELDIRGMSLAVQPGFISLSLQSKDLPFALEVIEQLVAHATIPADSVEKIREQLFSDIENFWDSPSDFIGQLAKQVVYDGHPYSRSSLGNRDSIARITHDDLKKFYQQNYSPVGATIAIVGHLESYNIPSLIEEKLGSWRGAVITEPDFPKRAPILARHVNYPLARDQVVLCFAGLSVSRTDEDFDALFLFDQIFSGGVGGGMNSRLFQLREQTGLFYTIDGSMVANAQEEPGIIFIRTIVSLENAAQAEALIKNAISTATQNIAEDDVMYARNAIISALVDNFESNSAMAEMFLFLDRFNFPPDYLDTRLEKLKKVTIEQIKAAVGKYLNLEHLATIWVGRVN